LKYFVLGALVSGLLLFGFSILYLSFGFLSFDAFYIVNSISLGSFFSFFFIFLAFSFKMGLFPFHM
jgi:NADH-quinone oxidoreductase subunit N